jgi:hypothetical protein
MRSGVAVTTKIEMLESLAGITIESLRDHVVFMDGLRDALLAEPVDTLNGDEVAKVVAETLEAAATKSREIIRTTEQALARVAAL